MAADGQTPLSGNLNANNNKLVNLAAGTLRTDATNVGQIQDGGPQYLTAVSGANTIAASLSGLTAYVAGQTFRFIPAANNTDAVTLNVNSIGAKNVLSLGSAPMLVAGQPVEVLYDGVAFQVIGASMPYIGTSATLAGVASRDVTGLPAGIKRLSIFGTGVRNSGAPASSRIPMIQFGDAGGIEATGYDYRVWNGLGTAANSTGFWINALDTGSDILTSFDFHAEHAGGNIWFCHWKSYYAAGDGYSTAHGTKTLSAVLDRFRITSTGGVQTFSGGTIYYTYG